ncbi:MAG TPA: hypothetical protein VGG43_15060 [Acidimicrobiales bacterium]
MAEQPRRNQPSRRRRLRQLAAAFVGTAALVGTLTGIGLIPGLTSVASATGTGSGQQWITAVGGAQGAANFTFGTSGLTAGNSFTSVGTCAPQTQGGLFPGLNVSTFIMPAQPSDSVTQGQSCQPGGSYQETITFSQPLIDPVLYVVNLDQSELTVGGTSTTGATITLNTVIANNVAGPSGNTINPTPTGVNNIGCEANDGTNPFGACGSFMLTATTGAIQSFTLHNLNNQPNGDGWSRSFSYPNSVTLTPSFGTTPIIAGGSTTVTYTLDNSAGTNAFGPVGFANAALPSGISTTGPAVLTGCGSGTATNGDGGNDPLTNGSTGIGATGVTVAANSTCAVTVPVTASTIGSYTIQATDLTTTGWNITRQASGALVVAIAPTAFVVSANPSSVPYGTASSLGESGIPAGASGTVTFKSGTTTLCTITVVNGLPTSCTTSTTLSAGSYPNITGSFVDTDGNYASSDSTNTTALSVTAAATSFTVAANPTSVPFATASTLSETGIPAGASGTVTFKSGTTTLCTIAVVNGSPTSCTTSVTLAPGSYPNITGSFVDTDGNYATSDSTNTADLTVTPAGTPFTVSAGPTSVPFGTASTLSETGIPAGASGTVTFKSGTTVLCTITVVNGSPTSCTTSTTLPVGSYPNITGSFVDTDGNYASSDSTNTADLTVTPAATSFTVAAGPTSVPFGTASTLSETGIPAGASGMVTFKSGTTVLCTITVVNGSPTSCTTSTALAPGSYPNVTGSFTDTDGNYESSNSTNTADLTVTPAPTPFTVAANPTSVPFGTAASLAESGIPAGASGTVTFKSGTTMLCTITVVNGSPTSCLTSTTLPAGSYPNITGSFVDTDGNYASSDSTNSTDLTVTPATQTITFTNTPPVNPTPGATFTPTATATSGLPVTFSLPASDTGICSLSGGVVTYVAPGACIIDADQAGNSNYAAAPQVSESSTVVAAPTAQTITFTNTPPVNPAPGDTFTPTATATSGLPVTFSLPASDVGICSLSAGVVTYLTPGTCVINADQAGNATFAPAPQVSESSAVKATQTITFTSSPPTNPPVGSTYTVSATSSSGGPVTFSSGSSSVCTVSGNVVTMVGPGTCVINAAQAGNSTTQPASATQSFTVPGTPPPPGISKGYWLVGSDGGIFAFGDAPFKGSLPFIGVHVHNIVGITRTADFQGYWIVGSDGGVFAFGDAPFVGSLPGVGIGVNNIVGIVPTADNRGYFLIGRDGGVFAFGDATFEGSVPGLGIHLNNIVGLASTPNNKGYWVVGADGTVYAFGNARTFGNGAAGTVAIASTLDGGGYWLVNGAGVVTSFGDAHNYGSTDFKINQPIVGIFVTPNGTGYWLAAADGGVFAFGGAQFLGSLPADHVSVNNVVGIISTGG